MTDDQRPELEWPSEDLAASAKKPQPRPEVEWPDEDVAKVSNVAPEPPKPAPAPPTPTLPPPAAPAAPTPTAPPTPTLPPPAADPVAPQPVAEPERVEPAFQAPTAPVPPVVPTPQPPAAPVAPTEPTIPAPAAIPPPVAPTPPPVAEQAPPPVPDAVTPELTPPMAADQPSAWNQQPSVSTEAALQPAPPPYPSPPAPTEPEPPDDPWAIPPSGTHLQQQQTYVPPPEFRQLPTDGSPAYPADGEAQPFGVPSQPGEQQPYGSADASQESYQNQYATPAQPAAPGPYAGAGVPPPAPTDTEDTADEGKSYFRKDIEGLRAVAVLAVLFFHVGVPYFDGGFVGVDVFYVISGFLITGLLLREGENSGKVDLLRFYARRMRRLLPAALLVIVVTLALSAFIVTPLRLTEIAGDAAASALYVANFRFAVEATDYLATAAPSPLLHFWSLGVEEQFYLFWPLILLVVVRFLPGRLAAIFVLLLALASFALSFVWTSTLPEWAFFSPLTRAWELAAGALIAMGLLKFPQRVPRVAGSVAVLLGLLLIAAAVFMGAILTELDLGNDEIVNALFATPETPFPGVAALLPVLGAVLVIMGGSHSRTLIGRFVLGNPVSRYIGRISYSLYLWHWPILILIPIQLGVDDLTTRLVLAGVAVVLAILSTELWERPWRRASVLEKRTGGTVRLGLVGSVGVGVTALLMSGSITLPSDFEVPWIQPPKVVAELAGVKDDLPAHYDDRCHLVGYGRKKLMTDCVYGDTEGEQTAVLVGDSHAAQWFPALDRYAQDEGWRLEVYTKAACPVIDVPVWERDLRKVFDDCITWRGRVLKHIRETKPDVAFVGLSRDYELWDGRVLQSSQARGYWQEQLTEYLDAINRPADEVVLLAETPFLNYDPVDCLADDDISRCDPPTRNVVDAGYSALERAAAEAADARLLSINELLCDDSTCPLVVDDVVVFRDNHHLTATYMERLAEPIGNLLEGRPAYPTPAPTITLASPEPEAETAAQADDA